jgi:hypothetical protein
VCAEVKATVYYIAIATVNSIVDKFVSDIWTAYQKWVGDLRTYQAALKAEVEANADPLKIFEAQIVIETGAAIQRLYEHGFHIALREQQWREAGVLLVNTTLDYIKAVNAAATADVLAVKRAAAKEAYIAWARSFVVLQRAYRWRESFQAEAEIIKQRIEAAIAQLEQNIRQAWVDARAKIIEWYRQEIEKIRERINAALENIRCDAGAAEVVVTEGDNTFRVEYKGIVCYDTSVTDEQRRAIACAALKAQLITEAGATVDLRAYACVAINSAKRQGQGMDVTIDGAEPPPPPPGAPNAPTGNPTASGVSITACFLILLISVLFHF